MTTEAEYRRRLSGLLDGVTLFADVRTRSGAILQDDEVTSSLEIALLMTLGVQSGYLAWSDIRGHWSRLFLSIDLRAKDFDFVRTLTDPHSLGLFQLRDEIWIEQRLRVDESLGEARFASFLNLLLDDMTNDFSLRAIALGKKFFPFEIAHLLHELSLDDQRATSNEHARFIYGIVQGTIDYGQFFEPLDSHLRAAYALPVSRWLLPLFGYTLERGQWVRDRNVNLWYSDLLIWPLVGDERWDDTRSELHVAWRTLREVAALLLEKEVPSDMDFE